MSDDTRDKLTEAALILAHLLDDPHPGAASWHESCERAYQALFQIARSDETPAPKLRPQDEGRMAAEALDELFATGHMRRYRWAELPWHRDAFVRIVEDTLYHHSRVTRMARALIDAARAL